MACLQKIRAPTAARGCRFANTADIDEFVDDARKFERGEMTPDQWRRFRLVRGTYGQRQAADAQMLRVKIPQGILTREQLEALADVGERYSRGFGHITTRQNIQFHFVKLHDVEPAMRRLADAGSDHARGVRQLGAQHHRLPVRRRRGATSVFDVTPYAEALTRFLLRHPLSSTLPRKFKIAFEGCLGRSHRDRRSTISASAPCWRRTAARGFRVTAAGGTAIMCRLGRGCFYEFLPASEILRVAEAVLRVFQQLGDYQHKQRNRMKFMIKTLGWDALARGVRARARRACRRRGRRPAAVRSRASAGRSAAAGVADRGRRRLATSRRASTASAVSGPGIMPTVQPRRWRTGTRAYARGAHQRAAAEAVRLPRWSR